MTTSHPPDKENRTMTLATFNHYVDRATEGRRIGLSSGRRGVQGRHHVAMLLSRRVHARDARQQGQRGGGWGKQGGEERRRARLRWEALLAPAPVLSSSDSDLVLSERLRSLEPVPGERERGCIALPPPAEQAESAPAAPAV